MLAGGAKAARHGATGLCGDAHRASGGVVHQHRFDEVAVCEGPKPFDGLAIIGLSFGGFDESARQLFEELCFGRFRQIRDLVGPFELFVPPLPDLPDPKCGLARQNLCQFAAADVELGAFLSGPLTTDRDGGAHAVASNS